MKVYKLCPDRTSCQYITYLNEDEIDQTLDWFYGTSLAEVWKPLTVGVYEDNGLPLGDYQDLGMIPVFNERAI